MGHSGHARLEPAVGLTSVGPSRAISARGLLPSLCKGRVVKGGKLQWPMWTLGAISREGTGAHSGLSAGTHICLSWRWGWGSKLKGVVSFQKLGKVHPPQRSALSLYSFPVVTSGGA